MTFLLGMGDEKGPNEVARRSFGGGMSSYGAGG